MLYDEAQASSESAETRLQGYESASLPQTVHKTTCSLLPIATSPVPFFWFLGPDPTRCTFRVLFLVGEKKKKEMSGTQVTSHPHFRKHKIPAKIFERKALKVPR